MARTRNLGPLLATLLIGILTFFFVTPKKTAKMRTKTSKTSVDRHIGEKDDLFI
ncbi:MAG: hypothetical protein ACJA08_001272 [Cyclobacteriaceae bacterium]|jgi:hypothetical protein